MNIDVQVSGPIFRFGGGPVIDSLHDAIEELVGTGEADVKESLTIDIYAKGGAHPDKYRPSGHYRRSIHGAMKTHLTGEIGDSKVIYGNWLEGVSSRNQSTRFKGYATFRRVKTGLERKKLGILEKHVRRAVGRLNA